MDYNLLHRTGITLLNVDSMWTEMYESNQHSNNKNKDS